MSLYKSYDVFVLLNTINKCSLLSWQKSNAMTRLLLEERFAKESPEYWNYQKQCPSVESSESILLLFTLILAFKEDGHACCSLDNIENHLKLSATDLTTLASNGIKVTYDTSSILLELKSTIKQLQDPKWSPWIVLAKDLSHTHNLSQALLVIHAGTEIFLSLPKSYEDQKTIQNKISALLNSSIDAEAILEAWKFVDQSQKAIATDFTPHYRQTLAAVLACYNAFTLISGGPGTGKTTVAKIIIWALKEMHTLKPAEIILAAPTGRAKARLLESLHHSNPINNSITEFYEQLEAFTLHSLLKSRSSVDLSLVKVFIIDESSMMDLSMFARLLEAIPPGSKLILLGDKDQLPSVEGGAVLADLSLGFNEQLHQPSLTSSFYDAFTNSISPTNFNDDLYKDADWEEFYTKKDLYQGHSNLANNIVFLNKGHRTDSKIMQWWSQASQEKIPTHSSEVSITTWPTAKMDSEKISSWIKTWVQDWNKSLHDNNLLNNHYNTDDHSHAFSVSTKNLASNFTKTNALHRILCSQNQGHLGVNELNQQCLKEFTRINQGKKIGSPIIILKNQYIMGLYISNGDLGILITTPEENTNVETKALVSISGKTYAIPLKLIHHWDYAFAMTVHKSQGSEFNKVAFFSPDDIESPLFSRQIIYTAITRAKNELALYLGFTKEEFYIPPQNLTRNSLLGWQNETMEN